MPCGLRCAAEFAWLARGCRRVCVIAPGHHPGAVCLEGLGADVARISHPLGASRGRVTWRTGVACFEPALPLGASSARAVTGSGTGTPQRQTFRSSCPVRAMAEGVARSTTALTACIDQPVIKLAGGAETGRAQTPLRQAQYVRLRASPTGAGRGDLVRAGANRSEPDSHPLASFCAAKSPVHARCSAFKPKLTGGPLPAAR